MTKKSDMGMTPAGEDAPVASNASVSRRKLLKIAAVGGASTAGIGLIAALPGQDAIALAAPVREDLKAPGAQVYMADATGMIVGDSTRCVGCRRCEMACTATHDGKFSPTIARIKVGRNVNFGPEGVRVGFWRKEGIYGNHRVIQETCNQCGHPAPCATACPNGAIVAVAPTNARTIDTEKCVGCRTCTQACPWEMISFDEDAEKATKCDLCGGEPACVAACPTGALRFVAWRDRTAEVPPRAVSARFVFSADDSDESCMTCHS